MKIGNRVRYNGHNGRLLKQCSDVWLIALDKPVSGIGVIAAAASSISVLTPTYRNVALNYLVRYDGERVVFSNESTSVFIACNEDIFNGLKKILGRNWAEEP